MGCSVCAVRPVHSLRAEDVVCVSDLRMTAQHNTDASTSRACTAVLQLLSVQAARVLW